MIDTIRDISTDPIAGPLLIGWIAAIAGFALGSFPLFVAGAAVVLASLIGAAVFAR